MYAGTPTDRVARHDLSQGACRSRGACIGAGVESRLQIGWVAVDGLSPGKLLTIFFVPTVHTLLARIAVPGEIRTPTLDDRALAEVQRRSACESFRPAFRHAANVRTSELGIQYRLINSAL